MPFTRFRANQRTQKFVLGGLLVIIALLLGLMAFRHLASPARDLDAAADAIAAAGGFTVEGVQRTNYTGPEVVQGQTTTFGASYAAPDKMTYNIKIPMSNAEGEIREFDFNSITIGDKHYVFESFPGAAEGYVEREAPLGQGMDLESAILLPQFLRNAYDLTYLAKDGELDGEPAIIITGYGDARDYPGVIFHDFLYQTALRVPFVVWLNPDTKLPLYMELAPRQWPPVVVGQRLAYELELTFTNFGPGEQVEPSPIVSPATEIIPGS